MSDLKRVSVVPLRRLPGGMDFFDYLWPAGVPVTRGSVVRAPFGRTSISGLVWGLSSLPAQPSLLYKPISGVISQNPVVSDWQLQVLTAMARLYQHPLGSLLTAVLPDQLPTSGRRLSVVTRPRGHNTILWYGSRRVAEKSILAWLTRPGHRLLLVPTIDDVADWVKRFPAAVGVTGQQTPKQYRQAYQAVLSGQTSVVVGTYKALWLPWPKPPHILLDREEHPAYRQTKSRPLFHLPRLLERLEIPFTTTTAAPRIQSWRPTLTVPPTVGKRMIGSLGPMSAGPWVSSELVQLIDSGHHRSIIALLPTRGFASSLVCGDCGFVIRCRHCHRAVRLLRHDAAHSRCQACGQLTPLPTRCPQCRGVAWRYSGLGVERWPTVLTAAGVHVPVATAQPYAQASRVRSQPGPRLVVLPAADSLFHATDYASTEHAWQYLATLSSLLDRDDTVLAQTFEPQSDFWQRWLHHQAAAFYAHLLADRQRHQLPPAVEQWIVTWPKADAQSALARAQQIAKRHGWQFRWQPLVDQRSRARWVVQAVTRSGLSPVRIPELFPAPWYVDRDSQTWLP